jgi:hypothetical protein
MTNILDRVAAERSSFRPETAQEFFALQLARKLDDVVSVHAYVALVDSYPEEFLLRVYRDTLDKGRSGDLAERFRLELRRRAKEIDP